MSNPASPGPVPAATRRAFLGRAMAAGLGAAGIAAAADAAAPAGRAVRHGRINQSVVPWCFRPMSLEELCACASSVSGLTPRPPRGSPP
ncbi:MAG: hypothetical protein LW690_13730 [Opitutaceae bacterium]|nr:hypothetical protein [Opitutaceae bacterium]